jgi:hypothetical protein
MSPRSTTIGDWTYTYNEGNDRIAVTPSRALSLDEQGVDVYSVDCIEGHQGTVEYIHDIQADNDSVLDDLGLDPGAWTVVRDHGWVLGAANDGDGCRNVVEEGDQIVIIWDLIEIEIEPDEVSS